MDFTVWSVQSLSPSHLKEKIIDELEKSLKRIRIPSNYLNF